MTEYAEIRFDEQSERFVVIDDQDQAVGFDMGAVHSESLETQSINERRTLGAVSVDELNEAIQAVSEEGGGSVTFRELTHEIDDHEIELRDGVYLSGYGRSRTVIRVDDTAGLPQQPIVIDGVEDVRISDLSVDGNRGRTDDGDWSEDMVDIGADTVAKSVIVERIHVSNCIGEAFDVDKCEGVTLRDVSAENVRGNAIHIGDDQATNVVVDGFFLEDGTERNGAVRVEGRGHNISNGVITGGGIGMMLGNRETVGVNVSNVQIRDPSEEALKIRDADGHPLEVTISGCRFEGTPGENVVTIENGTTGAITFATCQFVRENNSAPTNVDLGGSNDLSITLSGCHARGGNHAVRVSDGTAATITGCTLGPSGETAVFSRDRGSASVTGCDCEEPIELATDRNVVVGNTLRGGYLDDGDGNVVANNADRS